jgi:hypothetical protein
VQKYAHLSLALELLDCGRDLTKVVTPNELHLPDFKPIPLLGRQMVELVDASSISIKAGRHIFLRPR